jgi:hypothetical protein
MNREKEREKREGRKREVIILTFNIRYGPKREVMQPNP